MVKTVDSRANRPDTEAPPPTRPHEKEGERFCPEADQKCVQFFQFLKEWQSTQRGREGAGRGREGLVAVGEELMRFFNAAGAYSRGELDSHVVCLANLFNVLGDDIYQLRFERHFRTKLRHFAADLADAAPTPSRTPKLQALLYLLVVLIYRERVATTPTLPALTRSLLSDRLLVSSLLSLSLPNDKKTSKFYGIVMVYLATKKHSKHLTQDLVACILRNLGRVDHQPSRVNLIAYLRAQQNRVTIRLKEVAEGGVCSLLGAVPGAQLHPAHAHAMLDYLQHLLLLFPVLVHELPPGLLPCLLQTPAQHAPLTATISALLQTALKYLEPTARALLLHQLMQVRPSDPSLTLKVSEALLEHSQTHQQTIQLAQAGYFQPLLHLIHPHAELPLLTHSALLYAHLLRKVAALNSDLARCLLPRLALRLQGTGVAEAEAVVRELREKLDGSPF